MAKSGKTMRPSQLARDLGVRLNGIVSEEKRMVREGILQNRIPRPASSPTNREIGRAIMGMFMKTGAVSVEKIADDLSVSRERVDKLRAELAKLGVFP